MPKTIYTKEHYIKLMYHFFTEKNNEVPVLMKITGITESALNRRLDLIMKEDISKLAPLAKSNSYENFKKIYNESLELWQCY